MPETILQHVDPDRLRRASMRHVERVGEHRFLVEGRSEHAYLVDLDSDTPCRCRDAQLRHVVCLHVLAARFAAGDHQLVMQLGGLLAEAEREVRTLRVRERIRERTRKTA